MISYIRCYIVSSVFNISLQKKQNFTSLSKTECMRIIILGVILKAVAFFKGTSKQMDLLKNP